MGGEREQVIDQGKGGADKGGGGRSLELDQGAGRPTAPGISPGTPTGTPMGTALPEEPGAASAAGNDYSLPDGLVAALARQDQKFRVHENRGEAHFHVDAESLKCAIKTATVWEAWQALRSLRFGPLSRWFHHDEANASYLCLETRLASGIVYFRAALMPLRVAYDHTFVQMDNFCNPQRK